MKRRPDGRSRAFLELLSLTGTAFLGLAAGAPGARATPFDFSFTGTVVTFTVPTTDTYQILAFGAQGGSSFVAGGDGGQGAEIGGNFSLTAGESLQIAVGGAGAGEGRGGGGGGGSFVVGPGNTPLVIAGGGGGGGSDFSGMGFPGQGGLTGPNGGGAGGGTGGSGGGGGPFVGGGGGGGFFSPGGNGPSATGGGAFPVLTSGVPGGGFGGGGGGGGFDIGAGGGGGFSGGAGGGGSAGGSAPGGGGGSFDAGLDQILIADFQPGNGAVVITEIAVPEPLSIAVLGAGLLSLAIMRRRWPPA